MPQITQDYLCLVVSLCVSLRLCMCVWVHVLNDSGFMCVHVCMHVYVRVCGFMCCMCMYVYMCVSSYVERLGLYVCACVYVCVCG